MGEDEGRCRDMDGSEGLSGVSGEGVDGSEGGGGIEVSEGGGGIEGS